MSNSVQNHDSSDIERRLADTEARIAYQEDTLQTLSNQLYQQQQLADQLQRSLQLIYQQLRDMRDENGQQQDMLPPDDKPPHY